AERRGVATREALIVAGVAADRLTVGDAEVIASRDGSHRSLFVRTGTGDPDRDGRPIMMGIRLTRWSLWLGTALLVASGLTSFALGWRTILRAIRGFGRKAGEVSPDDERVARLEVPIGWLLIGGIPVTIGLMLLCWLAFGIAPWLGFLSVVLSFVLALVACRATGETDTTPIGAMGKITQFVYAVLAPANITVNLMTAGITAGAAGSSADLLTDLKSGYLLGANPRKQFLAQFFGVFFGVAAVIPAWYLLVPNREALEAFNSPATNMWYAVAQALSRGVETIPESARYAIVIGGIVGIVLALIEGLAPKKVKPFVPSSMGLGLAFIVPFANALSFFIGAVIAEIWTRTNKKTAERYIIPLASGAIAGESLAAAFYAMLAATGLLH
ncbi:MAG: OPT/YSL family transporter, partial [Myxococcota bacterium]|nr:OPT/YSL family transporter [Myxococcota bacterium]